MTTMKRNKTQSNSMAPTYEDRLDPKIIRACCKKYMFLTRWFGAILLMTTL